jgi:hypothetical protein
MVMMANKYISSTVLAAFAFSLFAACLYAVHLYRFGWFYLASDDSYIYLGYVRNWIEHGELLTYNPGEHSAGTTGLLYYYLLSAVASIVHFVYWPTPGIGLTLTAYITNAILFIGAGLLIARIWGSISDAGDSMLLFEGTFAVFAATVSLPTFIWGWFGGLENPLSGTILILLIERVLLKAPGWQIALASALIGGCRPELFPIGLLVVALWAVMQVKRNQNLRVSASGLAVGIATFVGITLLIYVPCWIVTGSITPSALGTRVAIPALTEPNLLWQNLTAAARTGYFLRPWVLSVPIILIGLLVFRRTREDMVLISVAGILGIYFLMRGALGLTDFNVQSRYVSFLWPLYVLMAGHILQRMMIRFGWGSLTAGMRRLTSLAIAIFLLGCVWIGFTKANNELSADVLEMNQLVVIPTQWMAQNLPKSARILMEPAGAIRVFTDFYLIDAVGLTTRHMPDYLASTDHPNLADFLQQTKATYIFDYPKRVALLGDLSQLLPLNYWNVSPQRYSGGLIVLYAIVPERLAR